MHFDKLCFTNTNILTVSYFQIMQCKLCINAVYILRQCMNACYMCTLYNEQVDTVINEDLSNNMKTIFSSCEFQKIPPFMRFFWKEQQKYLQVKK